MRLLRLAIAAMLALSACGVPTETNARPIPAQSASERPSPTPPQSGPFTETLYLVREGMLVPVQRRVPATPSVNDLMRDLLAGPTVAEQQAGMTSALLGSDVVASVHVDNGTATVDLAAGLEGTGRTDDVLAFGQIVCTLANRSDVTLVAFTRAGLRIAVPRGDGSLTQQPLSPADYDHLLRR